MTDDHEDTRTRDADWEAEDRAYRRALLIEQFGPALVASAADHQPREKAQR